VGAIDDRIEAVAIDLDVVAYITQLLDDVWIALAVDVAYVYSVAEIYIVNTSFVATHIALVKQVHTNRFVLGKSGFRTNGDRQELVLGWYDNLITTATCQGTKNKEQRAKTKYLRL
jgi:hypothetical protein